MATLDVNKVMRWLEPIKNVVFLLSVLCAMLWKAQSLEFADTQQKLRTDALEESFKQQAIKMDKKLDEIQAMQLRLLVDVTQAKTIGDQYGRH